jgi:predicted RNase H-like HicB family nuclease
MKLHRFLVVIERAGRNYSAYSPDLPGCVATGKTPAEVERKIHAAVKMHLDGLKEDNLPVPRCQSVAEYITVQS